MALTGKKKVFADAVFIGKTNKQAAIDAGYSAKTASPAGSRLAKDPAVVAYLTERRKAAATGEVVTASSPPPAPAPERKPFDVGAAMLHTDPQAFLVAAMNDGALDPKQRIVAARALMPFMHPRIGEGGKKQQKDDEAKKVAGRFAPAAPPKLVAAGGKKV